MPADGFRLTDSGWWFPAGTKRGRARELVRGPSRVGGRGVVVGRGGVAVTVRLDERTLSALMERAALEGISSRSDAIRAAVREWTHVA